MEDYSNIPSTSNTEYYADDKQQFYEYVDDRGNSVVFEAPSSAVFVDEHGNTVICQDNIDEFSHNVVQEEIVQMDDEMASVKTEEVKTSYQKNKFFSGPVRNTALLTPQCLETKAVLFSKSGCMKKTEDKAKPQYINKSGSLLNRNLPDMKNMFSVICQSALKKAENAFKLNENVDEESPPEKEFDHLEPINIEDEYDDIDMTVTNTSMRTLSPKPIKSWHELPLYNEKAIDFKTACELLTGIIEIPSDFVCKDLPLKYRAEGTFVIDQTFMPQQYPSLSYDNNGKWDRPSGKVRYYKEDNDGKVARVDDGKGKLKPWTNDYTYKITLKRYENIATLGHQGKGTFEKKIYTSTSSTPKECCKYAIITYTWAGGPPWDFSHLLDETSDIEPSKRPKWEKNQFTNSNLPELDKTVSGFFSGYPLYSHQAIDFNEAASICLGGIIVDDDKRCSSVPQGFKENGTFVVDLKHMSMNVLELRRDDNGQWSKPSGAIRLFKYAGNGDAVRVDRNGRIPLGLHFDVKVRSKRYDNMEVNKKFVRKIYTACGKNDEMIDDLPNVAVIVYYWKGAPIPFIPTVKQHSVTFRKDCKLVMDNDDFVNPNLEHYDDIIVPEANGSGPRSSKKARLEMEVKDILTSANTSQGNSSITDLRQSLLRREFENQERLASLLDRTENLLVRLEQRVDSHFAENSIRMYDQDGVEQVWAEDGLVEEFTEILEE